MAQKGNKPAPSRFESGDMSKRQVHRTEKIQDDEVTVSRDPATESLAGRRGQHAPRFYRYIRRKVALGLYRKSGYDWATAKEEAEDIPEEELDEIIAEHFPESRAGRLGDGSFLQWLIDHKDQILQLIMAIISILSMFADNPEDLDRTFNDLKSKKSKKEEAQKDDQKEEKEEAPAPTPVDDPSRRRRPRSGE
jgi:hypothetical protein